MPSGGMEIPSLFQCTPGQYRVNWTKKDAQQIIFEQHSLLPSFTSPHEVAKVHDLHVDGA